MDLWTSPGYLREIRPGGVVPSLLAAHLLTRGMHWTGLDYLPLSVIRGSLPEVDAEDLRQAFDALARADLAYRDEEAALVWLVPSLPEAVGQEFRPGDKRRAALAAHLGQYRHSPLVGAFVDRYGARFGFELPPAVVPSVLPPSVAAALRVVPPPLSPSAAESRIIPAAVQDAPPPVERVAPGEVDAVLARYAAEYVACIRLRAFALGHAEPASPRGPQIKSEKKRKLVRERIKSHGSDVVLAAMSGMRYSAWHLGLDTEGAEPRLDLERVLSVTAKVDQPDKLARLADHPPQKAAALVHRYEAEQERRERQETAPWDALLVAPRLRALARLVDPQDVADEVLGLLDLEASVNTEGASVVESALAEIERRAIERLLKAADADELADCEREVRDYFAEQRRPVPAPQDLRRWIGAKLARRRGIPKLDLWSDRVVESLED